MLVYSTSSLEFMGPCAAEPVEDEEDDGELDVDDTELEEELEELGLDESEDEEMEEGLRLLL